MSDARLSPCPHCGNDKLEEPSQDDSPFDRITTTPCSWIIQCKDCGVEMRDYDLTPQNLINKWNLRNGLSIESDYVQYLRKKEATSAEGLRSALERIRILELNMKENEI